MGPLRDPLRFASLIIRVGVVQWQYRSFPSFGHGFDSRRPLQISLRQAAKIVFHPHCADGVFRA